MLMIRKPKKVSTINLCWALIGPNGAGKTRMAGSFPGATLWLNTENRIQVGYNKARGDGVVDITDLPTLLSTIKYLREDNFTQGFYNNVAFDTPTFFYQRHESVLGKQFANDKNKFAVWAKMKDDLFDCIAEFLQLKFHGINVILTASGVLKTDDEGTFYSLDNPRLEKLIYPLVDNIFVLEVLNEAYSAKFRFPSKGNKLPCKAVKEINEAFVEGGFKPQYEDEDSAGIKPVLKVLYSTKEYEAHVEAVRAKAEARAASVIFAALQNALDTEIVTKEDVKAFKKKAEITGKLTAAPLPQLMKLNKQLLKVIEATHNTGGTATENTNEE